MVPWPFAFDTQLAVRRFMIPASHSRETMRMAFVRLGLKKLGTPTPRVGTRPLTVSDRGYLSFANEMTKAPVPDRGSHTLKGASERR